MKQIKLAGGRLSQDGVRRLFNQNFDIIKQMISELSTTLNSNNSADINTNNNNINIPSDAPEGSYNIVNENGQFSLVRNNGTQYRFENGESFEVGNKHQYLVKGDLILESGSNFTVKEGGELVIL